MSIRASPRWVNKVKEIQSKCKRGASIPTKNGLYFHNISQSWMQNDLARIKHPGGRLLKQYV